MSVTLNSSFLSPPIAVFEKLNVLQTTNKKINIFFNLIVRFCYELNTLINLLANVHT